MISHIFADVAVSGGSTVGREQMDAMLKYFETKPPDAGVVFWDYSRWARNYDDGQYMLSMLRRRGYLVHSLEEYVPPGSTGKIVESLHLWSAQQYREQLSKNVKRGLSYVIANHNAYFYPEPPIGYRFVSVEIGKRRDDSPHIIRQLEPDPVTAPLVQKAFAMRAGGASYKEIHEAVKFPRKFKKSYRHIFLNRLYIGIFDFGGNSYINFCEPIIDPETWLAVQQIRNLWQSRQGTAHPRRATSSHLLVGLLRCNRCGELMYGKRTFYHPVKGGVREHLYYGCSASSYTDKMSKACDAQAFNARKLDERIFQIVKTNVLREDVLSVAYDEARAHRAVQSDEQNIVVLNVRKNLASLNAAIDRLVSAIAEAGHSRSLLARLNALEQDRVKVQIQLIDLEAQAARPLPDLDVGELVREGLEIIEHGAFRQKQLYLRSFIREIRVELVDKEYVGEIDLILPGGDAAVFSI